MLLAKHLWQKLSAWISRTFCWFECSNHINLHWLDSLCPQSIIQILPVYHYFWPRMVANIISFVSLKICELERIWPTQLGATQHWRSKMLPWSMPLPTGHWRCIPPRPRWRFQGLGWRYFPPEPCAVQPFWTQARRCWDPVGPRSLVTLLSWPGRWLSTVLRTEGGKVLRGCSDARWCMSKVKMFGDDWIYDHIWRFTNSSNANTIRDHYASMHGNANVMKISFFVLRMLWGMFDSHLL